MRRPPPLGEKAATGCSSGCSSPPPTSRQPTCARGARGLVMQLLAGVFRLVCVCTIVCTRVRKMGRRVHCAAAACVAARAAMDARARRAERKSSGTVVGTPSRWKSEFVRDLASWGTFSLLPGEVSTSTVFKPPIPRRPPCPPSILGRPIYPPSLATPLRRGPLHPIRASRVGTGIRAVAPTTR